LIGAGGLHRVARVTELFKLDSFDDAPGFDVEAWNDSHGEHVRQGTKNSAALNPAFSRIANF
jgi:hypothetical protein